MTYLTAPEMLPGDPALYQETIALLAADVRGPLHSVAGDDPQDPYTTAGRLVEVVANSGPAVITVRESISALGILAGISGDVQLGPLDEHMQQRHREDIQKIVDYFTGTGLLA